MSPEILHILQHALGRNEFGVNPDGRPDYRNYFVTGEGSGDFDRCREAVAQGLMRDHGPRPLYDGDSVFSVTDAGKAHITEHSPRPPKLTRGQRRYRDYLSEDSSLSFGEWLRRKLRPEARPT